MGRAPDRLTVPAPPLRAQTKNVALIAGDGVGPEVMQVGVQVLEALAEHGRYPIRWTPFDLGAERYLRDGVTFPGEIAAQIREEFDAILLGALGDPRVPDLSYAREILFGIRFGFDLYCNVRPISCLSDSLMPLRHHSAADCDFVVFRENTEGIYVGVGGQFKRGTADEIAINEDINTRRGVERIIRAAFDYARTQGRTTVHMVDKHNAMYHAHDLWRRCFHEVAEEFSDITTEHLFVDAFCAELIQNPARFDVVVTCNLFGDIITDLGAALQGGMGMAASANIHPGRLSMFEPVHGSAPTLAGTDTANPFAMVLTVGMMMTDLGWPEAEARLTTLIKRAIEQKACTRDVGGTLGTRETGEALCGSLARAYAESPRPS